MPPKLPQLPERETGVVGGRSYLSSFNDENDIVLVVIDDFTTWGVLAVRCIKSLR